MVREAKAGARLRQAVGSEEAVCQRCTQTPPVLYSLPLMDSPLIPLAASLFSRFLEGLGGRDAAAAKEAWVLLSLDGFSFSDLPIPFCTEALTVTPGT